jgi:hypothetical protein
VGGFESIVSRRSLLFYRSRRITLLEVVIRQQQTIGDKTMPAKPTATIAAALAATLLVFTFNRLRQALSR